LAGELGDAGPSMLGRSVVATPSAVTAAISSPGTDPTAVTEIWPVNGPATPGVTEIWIRHAVPGCNAPEQALLPTTTEPLGVTRSIEIAVGPVLVTVTVPLSLVPTGAWPRATSAVTHAGERVNAQTCRLPWRLLTELSAAPASLSKTITAPVRDSDGCDDVGPTGVPVDVAGVNSDDAANGAPFPHVRIRSTPLRTKAA
jgi:hypothetical protein